MGAFLPRRHVLSTGLAAAGLCGLAKRAPAKESDVRIGWLKGTNDMTLLKARGTLEGRLTAARIGLQWAGPFPASAPAVEALSAGAIDLTIGSSTSAVTALAAGAPIVIFTYQPLGNDAEAIIVRQDSGIGTAADLAGRRIAVNRGGTGEYLLRQALARHHIAAADVTPIYLGPSDAGSALVQGAVDGWAIWDPWLSIALQSYDARLLLNRADIGSKNAIVMLAHREFAQSRRPVLEVVFRALIAENDWAVRHQDEAGRLWIEAMGLPHSLAARLGRNNAVPMRGLTAGDVAEIDEIARWYQTMGVYKDVPAVAAATIGFNP